MNLVVNNHCGVYSDQSQDVDVLWNPVSIVIESLVETDEFQVGPRPESMQLETRQPTVVTLPRNVRKIGTGLPLSASSLSWSTRTT